MAASPPRVRACRWYELILIAALAVESFLEWFQRFRRFLPWVMRISGALLIVVGSLLLSGEFSRLAGWLQAFTPEALREQL